MVHVGMIGWLVLALSGDGDAAAGAGVRRQFSARVLELEQLGRAEVPPEAIRTRADARWLLRLKLVKAERTVPGVALPQELVYAIRSPAQAFRLPPRAAIGQVFRFVEREGKGQPWPRLEVQPARPFDRVPGWRRLRWDMSDAEVRQALSAMRLAFSEDEVHGMFEKPGRPSARADAPRKPADLTCATFTRFRFQPDGGQAEAELLGWRLRRVGVRSAPLAGEKQLEARLRRLVRRYGEPDEDRPASAEPGAVRLRWFNDESSLSVTTARSEGGWIVFETYERMPPSWP